MTIHSRVQYAQTAINRRFTAAVYTLGLSKAATARLLEIGEKRVARIIAGRARAHTPDVEKLERLADAWETLKAAKRRK